MGKPIDFKESNFNWLKPNGMTDEECGSLPAYRDGKHSISCWKLGFVERIKILFTGKVWLWIFGGMQPPVSVNGGSPWQKEKEDDK